MDKTQLFFRKIENKDKYKKYLSFISNKFNDIENWNIKTIYLIYDSKYIDEYIIFRFNVLYNWVKNNLNNLYLKNYYDKLIYYIRLLNLNNYLNADEINFINQLNESFFLINKPIKRLIVNFNLNNNEEAYFHYNNVYLDQNNKKIFFNDCYLTNQRLILMNDFYITWFKLNNSSFSEDKDKIIINYFNYKFTLEFENSLNFFIGLDHIKNLKIK